MVTLFSQTLYEFVFLSLILEDGDIEEGATILVDRNAVVEVDDVFAFADVEHFVERLALLLAHGLLLLCFGNKWERIYLRAK